MLRLGKSTKARRGSWCIQRTPAAAGLVRADWEAMVTVIDERGLRIAREVRKAIAERESDEELQAAVEVYDRAVTPAERQQAASYLLTHTARVDARYDCAKCLALMRLVAPELLPEEEQ